MTTFYKDIPSTIKSLDLILQHKRELTTFTGPYFHILSKEKNKYTWQIYHSHDFRFLNTYTFNDLQTQFMNLVNNNKKVQEILLLQTPKDDYSYRIKSFLESFIYKYEREQCLFMNSSVMTKNHRILKNQKYYSCLSENMKPLKIL